MKPTLPLSARPSEAGGIHAILLLLGGLVLLAALALLPGPALFLAGLAAAMTLGINLAGLRRHGGPDTPRLPLAQEG